MAWSYSGDPTSSQRDEVRFLIGDVDEGEPLLSDEEIGYLLSKTGDVRRAAAQAARAIAARFSRQVDEAVGDIRLSLSKRAEQYWRLAAELGGAAGPAWAGPSGELFSTAIGGDI